MAPENPTNFYAQREVRPFVAILHKVLKKKKITWNQFLNAVIPPITAELCKDANNNESPIATLDLGAVDLSK
jgi:hypothetical protein